MNVSPPPTHLTETSTPDAGTFINDVGELAQTGSNTMTLVILGALLLGFGVAVMWLRAYTAIRQHPHRPIVRGSLMEAWQKIVNDLKADGVPADEAAKTATEWLGWAPGDPT